jgi:hypothetical protein
MPFIVAWHDGLVRGAPNGFPESKPVNNPENSPVNHLMARLNPRDFSRCRPEFDYGAPGGGDARLLQRTVFGRHIFRDRFERATARLCGVRVSDKLAIYGLAGVFFDSRINAASRLAGDPWWQPTRTRYYRRGRDRRCERAVALAASLAQ